MARPRSTWRGTGRLALAALAVAGALALAGCDLNENADLENGRMLFSDNCGTLSHASAGGLDRNAGAQPRQRLPRRAGRGYGPGHVRGRRRVPDQRPAAGRPRATWTSTCPEISWRARTRPTWPPTSPASPERARSRRRPRAGPAPRSSTPTAAQSCHTLAAAKATGVTGPNLDDNLPGMSKAEIEKSIIDPNADDREGLRRPESCPRTSAPSIDSADLKVLVDFLYDSTNGK